MRIDLVNKFQISGFLSYRINLIYSMIQWHYKINNNHSTRHWLLGWMKLYGKSVSLPISKIVRGAAHQVSGKCNKPDELLRCQKFISVFHIVTYV